MLAAALAAEGLAVTVLAPGTPEGQSAIHPTINVVRAPYWIKRWQTLAVGLAGIIPNLRRRPWLVLQVPMLIGGLIRVARRLALNADVVHAHWVYPCGLVGVIAARRAGVPLIVTAHGGDLNLARKVAPLRWIARWVSSNADRCIGVSHAMVEEFRALGIPQSKVMFVPLGVNPTNDPSISIEDTPSYGRCNALQGFRLLYAGGLSRRKSVHTLVEAHHDLERRGYDVATLIIGDGPERKSLQHLVDQLGARQVVFTGNQPPRSLGKWMSLADVLVLPSRSEGRGMVLIEAMALGIPIIASDIPGPREVIGASERGLLFPVGDSGALATQVERLIFDSALYDRLSKAGPAFIRSEGLTPQVCAKRHASIYAAMSRRNSQLSSRRTSSS